MICNPKLKSHTLLSVPLCAPSCLGDSVNGYATTGVITQHQQIPINKKFVFCTCLFIIPAADKEQTSVLR